MVEQKGQRIHDRVGASDGGEAAACLFDKALGMLLFIGWRQDKKLVEGSGGGNRIASCCHLGVRE